VITPTVVVTPPPPPTTTSLAAGAGAIRGAVFSDADANGQLNEGDSAFAQIDVMLSTGNIVLRTTRSGDDGSFSFDGVAPGQYRVTIAVPLDHVPTTDAGKDVDLAPGAEVDDLQFGLISAQAAGLAPSTDAATAESDDEQIIALASVTSLPLRFAEGRDLMQQVGRRVLGDGLVWLGVPFRSQIDGGDFQYVNCGPASLTMVLAGFGLEVGPSQVRDYLNNLIDNFDTDLGTSLDSLSRIAREAGLTPMDLYSDRGGYRDWSTDAVRWHIQQGHPVITLVKYRNLPGHSKSLSEFDHYIVISGLTPNGFIYNDAAFATTLGYGLEISDVELETAWDNSSIPHHAVALGLSPDAHALTFPELPRTQRTVVDRAPAAARSARRLAEADADQTTRAPLVLTPVVTASAAAAAVSDTPAVPLAENSDQWSVDPDFDPQPEVLGGSPMGLTMEPSTDPALQARPGPGAMVPKLLTLLSPLLLLWAVWLTAGYMSRLPVGRVILPLRRAVPPLRRGVSPLRRAFPSLRVNLPSLRRPGLR
jgi:hypothetical protein